MERNKAGRDEEEEGVSGVQFYIGRLRFIALQDVAFFTS